ncbi:MAG: peptide-methionine (S)-S-oxide reductase MsrA [Flavobacteriales bacterium]|nr:peptide-methionine (S)-S-oxide reductase MsrA [Flavobacteriales bacterium]
MKAHAMLLFTAVLIAACSSPNTNIEVAQAEVITEAAPQDLSGYSIAYFASGCFWCVEEVFESVKGVPEAVSGYSGGSEENPTYAQVGSGSTSHAEAVMVYYDPKVVSYATLVKVFFASQDPTTPNRQGPDRGTQYRSIAFYRNAEEKAIIQEEIAALNASGKYSSPIVTEVVPFEKFWPAEDYHQDYVRHHPDEGYVRGVSIPRFERFKKAMPEVLK